MSEIRLTLGLVPATCWFSNLRSELSGADWDRLRRECYRAAGYRCEVCGGKGPKHPVECHERWGYQQRGTRNVQKLLGLIALCPACHEVKHFGRAQLMGRIQPAFDHLRRVNGWGADETRTYLEVEFDVWQERSRHQWDLDLTWLRERGMEEQARVVEARQRSRTEKATDELADEMLRDVEEEHGPAPDGTARAVTTNSCGHLIVVQVPEDDPKLALAYLVAVNSNPCPSCEAREGRDGDDDSGEAGGPLPSEEAQEQAETRREAPSPKRKPRRRAHARREAPAPPPGRDPEEDELPLDVEVQAEIEAGEYPEEPDGTEDVEGRFYDDF